MLKTWDVTDLHRQTDPARPLTSFPVREAEFRKGNSEAVQRRPLENAPHLCRGGWVSHPGCWIGCGLNSTGDAR